MSVEFKVAISLLGSLLVLLHEFVDGMVTRSPTANKHLNARNKFEYEMY